MSRGKRRDVRVHGIFNIDKPTGMTSHDVVDAVRKLVRHRQVGHAGTLDPMATGVLVVVVGVATRLVEFMADHEKVYRFTIRLGEETDTLDAEGQVVERKPVPPLEDGDIRKVLEGFVGEIEQQVPLYAAVRHRGRRLYEWARDRVPVEPKTRRVVIHELTLEAWEPPLLTLRVRCSAGTYVRSLARDVARALGTVGHVVELRRLASGPFRVEEAVPLAQLLESPDWQAYLLPVDAGIQHIPRVDLSDAQWQRVRHGQPLTDVPPPEGEEMWRRAYVAGRLVAMLRWDPEKALWRPRKVLMYTSG